MEVTFMAISVTFSSLALQAAASPGGIAHFSGSEGVAEPESELNIFFAVYIDYIRANIFKTLALENFHL